MLHGGVHALRPNDVFRPRDEPGMLRAGDTPCRGGRVRAECLLDDDVDTAQGASLGGEETIMMNAHELLAGAQERC